MNAAFLKYYNDELDQLRGKAQRFAERHPKIAGRLRMSPNTVDDPHVERLLQGVAFATARVRQRIDDHFPELTDTLLETLYPNYLAPFPSTTIVQIAPDADQDDGPGGPAGLQQAAGERARGAEGDRGQQGEPETAERPRRAGARAGGGGVMSHGRHGS